MVKFWLTLATALGLLLPAESAFAFHAYFMFADPVQPDAETSGGNGVFFTGSPRWGGLDCASCHVGGEGLIRVELTSEPAELFDELRYTPGAEYLVHAAMLGEHRYDPAKKHNENSFLMELNDDGGAPVGEYAPSCRPCNPLDPNYDLPPPSGLDWNVTQVLAVKPDRTEWSFYVRMPEAGTGPLTLYLSAVDGDSSSEGEAPEPPTDPLNDDTWTGRWRLCEGDAPCQESLPTAGDTGGEYVWTESGCSLGPTRPDNQRAWLLALMLAAFLGRSTTRPGAATRRRLLVLLPLLALSCQELEEARPLPDLDYQAFRCSVQPVLVARCGFYVCHGSALRPLKLYGPNRLRLAGSVPSLAAPLTPAEEQHNFDAARAFADDERLEAPWLLLKPLDLDAGGLFHLGKTLYGQRDVFASTADPGFQAIGAWLAGGTADEDCTPSDEVGP